MAKGDGVSVNSASPVNKYTNGSLYDRDGKVTKPRAGTGNLLYNFVTH